MSLSTVSCERCGGEFIKRSHNAMYCDGCRRQARREAKQAYQTRWDKKNRERWAAERAETIEEALIIEARRPTPALPGSLRKIQILQARVAGGLPLWLEMDGRVA